MRAFIVPVVSMLIVFGSGCDEKEDEGFNQSLLWELSKNGTTSHVFGTIHLPHRDFENMPPEISDAIRDCNVFYTEMEPDSANSMQVMRQMRLPDGIQLREIAGEERFNRLLKVAASNSPSQISPELFDRYKVWAALLLITYPKKTYDLPLDVLLYQKAQMSGRETRGIESPDEQVATLDSFTLEQQLELLDDSIKEAENGYQTLDELFRDYVSQDISSMAQKFIEMECGMSEELKQAYIQRLIIRRNHVFADRLAPVMERQKVFAAVGAGHLTGKENVIKLLRDKGFSVKPVAFKFNGDFTAPGKEFQSRSTSNFELPRPK